MNRAERIDLTGTHLHHGKRRGWSSGNRSSARNRKFDRRARHNGHPLPIQIALDKIALNETRDLRARNVAVKGSGFVLHQDYLCLQ